MTILSSLLIRRSVGICMTETSRRYSVDSDTPEGILPGGASVPPGPRISKEMWESRRGTGSHCCPEGCQISTCGLLSQQQCKWRYGRRHSGTHSPCGLLFCFDYPGQRQNSFLPDASLCKEQHAFDPGGAAGAPLLHQGTFLYW